MNDITLKHICQEFKLDPYKFRMALRKANFPKPRNRHWRWKTKEDPHYIKCRSYAELHKGRLQ